MFIFENKVRQTDSCWKLTVRKGCRVFWRTLLSVTVCATSSWWKKTHTEIVIKVKLNNYYSHMYQTVLGTSWQKIYCFIFQLVQFAFTHVCLYCGPSATPLTEEHHVSMTPESRPERWMQRSKEKCVCKMETTVTRVVPGAGHCIYVAGIYYSQLILQLNNLKLSSSCSWKIMCQCTWDNECAYHDNARRREINPSELAFLISCRYDQVCYVHGLV